MRFILALLLVLSVPSHAQIQPFELNLPITCGDTNKMIEGLREEYDEEIVMMSSDVNELGEELYHSLWINAKNKTWSFIVVNKPKGITCMLASGSTLQMFFPGKQI